MARTTHEEFVVESHEPDARRSKFCGLRDFSDLVDEWLSASRFGHFFHLAGSGHPNEISSASAFREVRAGLTTFTTMAYIIAAAMLSQTGGTCECSLLDKHKCDTIPEFAACKEEIRRSLVTSTAAIAGMASFVFGLLTNLPVAIAPGMGLNAYFAFQVVGVNGTGSVPYRTALTATFVEGFIFIFLALTGMRQWLVKLIPATLKTATGVGIGFLLTEIGLSYSAGIGAITGGGRAVPLTLGGCPPEFLDPSSGIIKYALVIGIGLVSIISWPRNTAVTYFPDTNEGNSRFEFFKQVVAWHPLNKVANQLEWDIQTSGSKFALALFTFLYVDVIDATATLYSMVRFCGAVDPKDGDFPRSTLAYCTDAAFISVAALFGSSPVTAFIESGAGIAEGGTHRPDSNSDRTLLYCRGILCANLCLHSSVGDRLHFDSGKFPFVPISDVRVTNKKQVGCMMIRQITQINWRYIGDVLPSFVVMTFIPFTYSVAYGLIAGIFTYAVLNGLIGAVVWISGGRYEPREYDLKEYWTWKGTGQPPWFVRAIRQRRQTSVREITTPSVGAADFHSRQHENRVVSFSADSHGGMSSAKEESGTVTEQPILSRPTPEQVSRMIG
ncbi:hypothetical protein NQ176_g2524 [Zarea fungicola]|uniref:Uncharacterized protein n=1 Tax=Zarea fungicola TaxID=93591 RepID=A0ACC1NNZ3_9HYPO|nr:hypothetical protein NQ176_g2524 [Lecanicillium fungicola]